MAVRPLHINLTIKVGNLMSSGAVRTRPFLSTAQAVHEMAAAATVTAAAIAGGSYNTSNGSACNSSASDDADYSLTRLMSTAFQDDDDIVNCSFDYESDM